MVLLVDQRKGEAAERQTDGQRIFQSRAWPRNSVASEWGTDNARCLDFFYIYDDCPCFEQPTSKFVYYAYDLDDVLRGLEDYTGSG